MKKIFALILVLSFVFLPIPQYTPATGLNNTNPLISATFAPDFALNDVFTTGDEISMTLDIANNPGFAAMIIRINIPETLELIGFELHFDSADPSPDINYGFFGPACDDEDCDSLICYRFWDRATGEIYPPMTGNIFAGWQIRQTNFYENVKLFTYTFRVTENIAAAQISPITIAFANADPAYETPTALDGTILQIPFGGEAINERVWRIGSINIWPRPSIEISPGFAEIDRRNAAQETFQIALNNVPPFYPPIHFCTKTPTANSPVDINIGNLPPGIRAFGIINYQQSPAGTATGQLILEVYDSRALPHFANIARQLREIFP